jgi:hypothetical protein
MRQGRSLALQSQAPAGAHSCAAGERPVAKAVGGVDPGGQLTASGGALRVDAMMGIGQQTLPGSIRPPVVRPGDRGFSTYKLSGR